ncbi:unnamed protein product [Parascedosporium putredinis]|uniref:Uncharacterized protein n=1 Tax=Parascedosporium putredinis TaxID=1442378 RepID=A0A9P1M7Q4_9PEZI|nr:unnamed protein product [Parascedosporium putredinis]CAI7992179.1 unnamed protein product [Parascedosporium putredinis]
MAPTSNLFVRGSPPTKRSMGLDDPISLALVGISVSAIIISIVILLAVGRNRRNNAVLAEELHFHFSGETPRGRAPDFCSPTTYEAAQHNLPLLLAEPSPPTPGLYPPPAASPPLRSMGRSDGDQSPAPPCYWQPSSRRRAGSREPSPMGRRW